MPLVASLSVGAELFFASALWFGLTAHSIAQGLRLERVWCDLKFWWNKFHALKGGFVADDCQPNSAFGLLSDETCLATFLGFNSEDNELVKVMKALMMLQVVTESASDLTVVD